MRKPDDQKIFCLIGRNRPVCSQQPTQILVSALNRRFLTVHIHLPSTAHTFSNVYSKLLVFHFDGQEKTPITILKCFITCCCSANLDSCVTLLPDFLFSSFSPFSQSRFLLITTSFHTSVLLELPLNIRKCNLLFLYKITICLI